jgi:hypothetical protein
MRSIPKSLATLERFLERYPNPTFFAMRDPPVDDLGDAVQVADPGIKVFINRAVTTASTPLPDHGSCTSPRESS